MQYVMLWRRTERTPVRDTSSVVVGLLAALAFLLPFEAIGAHIGSYLVAPSTIVGVFLSAYLAIFQKQRTWPLLFFLALSGWFLVTVVMRFPVSTYAMSLAAFVVMAFPIVSATPRHIRADRVLAAFKLGFGMTFALVMVEFLVQVIAPQLLEALQLQFLSHTRTHEFLGFTRVKGLMLEPAHLAIYLCFAYVIFDLSRQKGQGLLWQQWAAALMICLSMSLSGIVILFPYLAVQWSRAASRALVIGGSQSVSALWRIFIVGLIVAVGLAANWHAFVDFLVLVTERTIGIYQVLMSADYVGSIGSRANALPVMAQYWVDHWPIGSLAGTGYGNFEQWLVQTYGYLGWQSSFARGELNSIIAVVGLSTGMIGLGLYFGLLFAVMQDSFRGIRLQVFIFLVMVQLAYGYLIVYLFWHCMLVLIIAAAHRERRMRRESTPSAETAVLGRVLVSA